MKLTSYWKKNKKKSTTSKCASKSPSIKPAGKKRKDCYKLDCLMAVLLASDCFYYASLHKCLIKVKPYINSAHYWPTCTCSEHSGLPCSALHTAQNIRGGPGKEIWQQVKNKMEIKGIKQWNQQKKVSLHKMIADVAYCGHNCNCNFAETTRQYDILHALVWHFVKWNHATVFSEEHVP